MRYDRMRLAARVREELEARPRATLRDVEHSVRVERHAVEDCCRSMGSTFLELRQTIRFEKACALLAQSPEGTLIKEVAAAVGYSSRSFARFVKSRSGKTPAALRHSLRDGG